MTQKNSAAKKASADFLSKVKAGASKAPEKAKAKCKGKVVYDAPENVKKLVNEFCSNKKKLKALEAEIKFAESEILEFAKADQDKSAFSGDFVKSFDLPGFDKPEEGEPEKAVIKFVSTNRFSINPADQEVLQNLLGKSYDDVIEEELKVVLKKGVLEDEEKLAKLAKVIGDDFDDFFESSLSLKVQTDADKKVYKVAGDQDSLDELRTYMKPYKPALRV